MVLFSTGGNLETAFALPAIYSNACPPPSDSESADVTAYEDGGWFEYDPATGRWIIRGVKTVLIESSQVISCKTGEFVIEADTTRINSNVILNGDVTHGGGAMTSNGVVADKHKHLATVAERREVHFDALYRDEPRYRQSHNGN